MSYMPKGTVSDIQSDLKRFVLSNMNQITIILI